MSNSVILVSWISIVLSGLPYLAATVVHLFSVHKIWIGDRPLSKVWWSPMLVAPVVSVLYPLSGFSKALDSWEIGLILLGVGLGTVLLLLLILIASTISRPSDARMPSSIKLPIHGYVLWSELLSGLSTIIILFEMCIAMILAA